jgi:hypothetical protein
MRRHTRELFSTRAHDFATAASAWVDDEHPAGRHTGDARRLGA